MQFEHFRGEISREERERIRSTEIYKRGDTVCVWVNEGDLYVPPVLWRPIYTAPADRKVLVWDGADCCVAWRDNSYEHLEVWVYWTQDYEAECGCVRTETGSVYPTHWMPLPEPADLALENRKAGLADATKTHPTPQTAIGERQ